MFTHILIATDGSELADRAISTGLNLAKSLKAKVTFIAVTEPRTLLVPDHASAFSTNEHDAALAKAASSSRKRRRRSSTGFTPRYCPSAPQRSGSPHTPACAVCYVVAARWNQFHMMAKT
jgi:nucleotide-binding universal stress UspA family protein